MFAFLRYLLVGLLLLPLSAAALELDSTCLATIRQGMDLAFTDHYQEAKDLFSAWLESDSTDHAAYLFLAGVYHAEMLDREDYADKETFNDLIQRALELADTEIDTAGNPAWAYLTRGNAYGYQAAFEGKQGSWWSAVKMGIRAKNNYLKALEADSSLYDAYLGLGTYHYWKSAKTEFINWLPLVKDRKEQGIAELRLAVDSSLFSRTMAANSLVWVYWHYGQPIKALNLARELEKQYPDSRMVLWGMAFAYYNTGRHELAFDYFGRLITQIESLPDDNYFNLIECRYHRAQILRLLGRADAALAEIDSLLNYPIPDETRDRQKDKLKRVAKWQEELRSDDD